ncbi:GNAT family N-acetyltransferase [bacterium]|uniref:N-acetyltransferase domain-containing protein n=2 Tax=Katanobacteria TaxID=422282 RepID=A0A2M7X3T1_UNCKA|nr:GNAT family N-acetyltransferase [bacterium]PIP56390.1 MAG: hypothetical protein COX05_03225 [candidate division WWE3 bacterium CG22_combo_CG10-13_8_21_14_all_39_12]PJA40800.1 MAG: hypothetical protein CO179_01410 [candidate division WWE3 bacterium CG_4_9_14_3_um_filter_39_7]
MKLLFSEHLASYNDYAFPYQVWALEDNNEDKASLLNMGFLPSRMKIGLWYLARSTRIDLNQFEPSSENRRVIKKTSPYHFTIQSSDSVRINNTDLLWMRQFVIDVMGDAKVSDHAIKRMFSHHMSDVIFTWKRQDDDRIAGMIPVMVSGGSMFYWMAFINTAVSASGLGSRMMLEAINWAKNDGLSYAYLGTAYSQASLYKTNFSGFEFFDGSKWNTNIDALKYLLNKESLQELLKDKEWLDINGYKGIVDVLNIKRDSH